MSNKSIRILKMIFQEKMPVLLIFLCVDGLKIVKALIYSQESDSMKIFRLVLFLVYCVLSFFAYKGNKIATFVMAISILLSGIGALAVCTYVVSVDKITLQIMIAIVIGVYFIWGGIMLIQGIRKTSNTPKISARA